MISLKSTGLPSGTCCLLGLLFSMSTTVSGQSVEWVDVPGSSHAPKVAPSAVYDPANNRFLMVGGYVYLPNPAGGNGFYQSNDVLQFTYSGGWSPLALQSSFAPRNEMQGCYDSQNSRVVFAHGFAGPSTFFETWTTDGNQFRQLGSHGSLPVSFADSMFYNTAINAPCFVGTTGAIYKLSGADWVIHSAPPESSIWPPTADGMNLLGVFAVSYNPNSQRLVLFGGHSLDDPPATVVYDKTLVYDASTEVWSSVATGQMPPPRHNSAMEFYPPRGTHILVGGRKSFGDSPVDYDDIWEFNDSTMKWQQFVVTEPKVISAHAIAYDSDQKRLLVFGDQDLSTTVVRELVLPDPPLGTGFMVK